MANLILERSNCYISADGYGAGANSGPGAGYANTSNSRSGSGATHGGRGYAGYGQDPYLGSCIRKT